MGDVEFDRHATQYRRLHEHNLSISGEDPEYFADYKMRDFRALICELGLPLDGCYLDFGSGIGASVAPFRKHMPLARLVCVDVSSESLVQSQATHDNAAEHVCISDGNLPFADAQFDGAFACCVFHHIPHGQHRQILGELRRVLEPGGLLMIYEHNPLNPLTVHAVRTCPFDENAVLLTAGQLQRVAGAAGFGNYRKDYRVFFPAGLALLRPIEERLRWLPLGAQYFVALRA